MDDDEFNFSDGTATTSDVDFKNCFPADPVESSEVMYAETFLSVLNYVSGEYIEGSDRVSGDRIEKLALLLSDRKWVDAETMMSEVTQEEYFPCLGLAAALAGMPGYADVIARRYAGIAVRLSLALRQHRPVGSEQERVADEAAYRLRSAVICSVSWSAVAGGHNRYRRGGRVVHDSAYDVSTQLDVMLTSSIVETFSRRHRDDIARNRDLHAITSSKPHSKARGPDLSTIDEPDVPETEEESPVDDDDLGVVVVRAVGGAGTSGGKEAAAAIKDLMKKWVPLIYLSAHEIEVARQVLVTEFPYAADVVHRILSDVVPGEPVRLRPTLLLGEPGGGKSRLAERLCQELALPCKRLDAGSTNDKSIVGSPRRWHSSYPSLPVTVIQEHFYANPAIVIDELEKAGTSSAGSIHEPLLSLVDRKTAAAWHDQYIDGSVNLSFVNWLFTANSQHGIPAPLRNRLRVLTVPRPGKEHLPAIASRVLSEMLAERGVDSRFEAPLDGVEIEVITKAWDKGGGSIRHLQRLVEAVVNARHQSAQRN